MIKLAAGGDDGMIIHRQKSAKTIYTRKGEAREGGTSIKPLQDLTGVHKTNSKSKRLALLDIYEA